MPFTVRMIDPPPRDEWCTIEEMISFTKEAAAAE